MNWVGNSEVSVIVSDALSEVVRSVVDETGQQRLIIAGGKRPLLSAKSLAVGDYALGEKYSRDCHPV